MKREIIIKLSFAVFVYIIVVIVDLLNTYINNLLGTNIDPKYFLPLISFLFYDIWIKYFELFTVTLNVKDKNISNDTIEFRIVVKYRGREKLHFSLESISGVKGYNPELIYSNISKQQKKYDIPENFEILIDNEMPVFYLNIKLNFKEDVKPRISIPFINIEVFLIKIAFLVGDKKRIKRIFIIRRSKI